MPDSLTEQIDLIRPFFDTEFYAQTPDLPEDCADLIEHFCTTGWKELRNPSPEFDLWWYWVNHLDPAHDTVNPVVHYALTGRELGLSTRPPAPSTGPGERLPDDRPVRRACLFAGFDADGLVDEAALLLLRELSRFADVFCLFDCFLEPEALAELQTVCTEAWAIRHGAYDFGSYSKLASELVGWDRLAEYDEVLLVNDSFYLLRPLDDVFARMDAQACDWWGLQATKGISLTRDTPENQFQTPIPLDRVRDELLSDFEKSVTYDFLLGSYFLALRRPVLQDPIFRKFIEGVVQQPTKLLIIRKYEIGLTRLLIGRGHRFATFMPELYPFHPVYSEWAFVMIANGFPLIKRYLLHRNHYDVPDIASWREQVLDLLPQAPVEVFERHLARTAPHDRRHRGLSIHRGTDGEVVVPSLLAGTEFVKADRAVASQPAVWVFAVDRSTHQLPASSRAILERIRGDHSVTKIVLTRGKQFETGGSPDLLTAPIRSPEGQSHLMRAGVVLVAERPSWTLQVPTHLAMHHVVAVRHGLRLHRHGSTAARSVPDEPSGPAYPARPLLTGILTASALDEAEALASHWPTPRSAAWRTGLPWHDLLLTRRTPDWLAGQEERLRSELAGRRLLLLLPAPLDASGHRLSFDAAEVERLAAWARSTDTVIGVRDAAGDFERPLASTFGKSALDLSPVRFPDLAAVLRAADALLTDHDDSAVDFTVTGRPVIGFAPHVADQEEDLLYPIDQVFPGRVHRDFDALLDALEHLERPMSPSAQRHYEQIRNQFVEHQDAGATDRVIARIRALTGVSR